MKKRIITIVFALTMAVSLSACGSKSDTKTGNKVTLTMDEIQDKMAEAIPNVKSVDADLDIALDLSMKKSEGQEVSVKAGLNGEAQVSISNLGYHIKGDGSMSIDGLGSSDIKQSGEMEIYMVTDTDTDTATGYYTKDGKEWFTSSMPMDEVRAGLAEMLDDMNIAEWGDLDFSDLGEPCDDDSQLVTIARILENFPLTLKPETVKAAGKECYEISTIIDKDAFTALPEMKEYAAELEEVIGAGECKMAVYIDVATNLPVKVEITAEFSIDLQSVSTDNEVFKEMSINLNECKAVLELEYDTVDAIEVPGNVKDIAVEEPFPEE